MTRRNDVIEVMKEVVGVIKDSINDGLKEDMTMTPDQYKKWVDRWYKIDNLIIEADDAHFKALFENLIESGKTDVSYNSRSICDWKHGTLIKYLKRYKVLIKSDKGRLITRSIDCLLMDEDGLPSNFRFAIYRAYRDGKILRTWKKYA